MSPLDPRTALQEPLPPAGVSIPLLATFSGLAGVPLLSLAKNNLSARLRLFPDELEFKVLRTLRRPYSRIRRVEVQTLWATRNVELVWNGSAVSFTANVRTDAWRLAVLRLLDAKGVTLAPGARRLLEQSPDQDQASRRHTPRSGARCD